MANKYPDTPTLDKLLEVRERSQIVGEFLNWFIGRNGFISL